MSKQRNNYWMYALLTVAIWSSVTPFTKIALEKLSFGVVGLLRFVIASIACLVIVLVKKIRPPRLRDWPKFFLSGALGFTLYTALFGYAATMISSATTSILGATNPVIVAILAFFIYHERMSGIGIVAMVIELAGICLMMLWNGIFSINVGLIWMLLGILMLSLYNLYQRSLIQRYSVLQTTIYSIFAGTILLCVFLPQTIAEWNGIDWPVLGSLAYLGIVGSAVAYISWNKAFLLAAKTSDVTNFMLLAPLLGSLFGFLISGELPDLPTYLGGAIILVGMLLLNFGPQWLEQHRAKQKPAAQKGR